MGAPVGAASAPAGRRACRWQRKTSISTTGFFHRPPNKSFPFPPLRPCDHRVRIVKGDGCRPLPRAAFPTRAPGPPPARAGAAPGTLAAADPPAGGAALAPLYFRGCGRRRPRALSGARAPPAAGGARAPGLRAAVGVRGGAGLRVTPRGRGLRGRVGPQDRFCPRRPRARSSARGQRLALTQGCPRCCEVSPEGAVQGAGQMGHGASLRASLRPPSRGLGGAPPTLRHRPSLPL